MSWESQKQAWGVVGESFFRVLVCDFDVQQYFLYVCLCSHHLQPHLTRNDPRSHREITTITMIIILIKITHASSGCWWYASARRLISFCWHWRFVVVVSELCNVLCRVALIVKSSQDQRMLDDDDNNKGDLTKRQKCPPEVRSLWVSSPVSCLSSLVSSAFSAPPESWFSFVEPPSSWLIIKIPRDSHRGGVVYILAGWYAIVAWKLSLSLSPSLPISEDSVGAWCKGAAKLELQSMV